MEYLLDADILSDLVRHPNGIVAKHIQEVGSTSVCTSIIVAAELRYGAAKRASPKLTARVEGVLIRIRVEPFEAPADAAYGIIRSRLEKMGRPIGANDLFIAAHAIALGCTLVTANEREFARVDGLNFENWLR
ncbi:MAG: type II toxin-antitoxin system VapC family toxin [Rhodomicrobium sp.]|jgi:tRNA(fMet)-specific endonuclease VapC